MDHSGPVEVHPPDDKDYELLTYTYANGTVMHHDGGFNNGNGVLFKGTEGSILVWRGHLSTDPPEIMQEPTQPDEVHLYNSRDHRANFLECVRRREKPICDVEIGCRSVSVCHLGNLAYWLKRPLK